MTKKTNRQITDLHLDTRLASSREAINKTFATGGKAVSGAFNTLWADIEVLRETQRKKLEVSRSAAATAAAAPSSAVALGKRPEALDDDVGSINNGKTAPGTTTTMKRKLPFPNPKKPKQFFYLKNLIQKYQIH